MPAASHARLLLLLAALAPLAACATVYNGTTRVVQIEPAMVRETGDRKLQVKVITDVGAYDFQAPGIITFRGNKTSEILVRVTEPCYEPVEVTVDRHLTPIYLMNLTGPAAYVGISLIDAGIGGFFKLLAGVGVVGILIDPLTGALWDWEPYTDVPGRPIEPVEEFERCKADPASYVPPPPPPPEDAAADAPDEDGAAPAATKAP